MSWCVQWPDLAIYILHEVITIVSLKLESGINIVSIVLVNELLHYFLSLNEQQYLFEESS